MGSHCTAITSIKTVGSKQIEGHCKDITSIKLLTQNDVFKYYVNKIILLSHFKYKYNFSSSVDFVCRYRKVTLIYTCQVILKSF